MTANALVDALGAAIAQNGVGGVPTPSGPALYSTGTGQITYSWGNTYNIGGGTVEAIKAAFNALYASCGTSYQALFSALAGTFCAPGGFTYVSNVLGFTYGNPYGSINGLTQTQLTNIGGAFNALSSAILGGVVVPPPPVNASSPAFVRGIIVGGESTMCNSGGALAQNGPIAYTLRHGSRQWNVSPANGALAPMSIPLPGLPGSWVCDSFIPQMADLLLDTASVQHLVIGDVAIVGQKFSDFAPPSGSQFPLIGAMLGYFKSQRIEPSVVMWGMGINDTQAASSAQTVEINALAVIGAFRGAGYRGPIVFSLETIFNNGAIYQPVIDGLTAAVAASANCFIGPNHDVLLGPADKYDGTHPNYTGETKLATAWSTVIAPYLV